MFQLCERGSRFDCTAVAPRTITLRPIAMLPDTKRREWCCVDRRRSADAALLPGRVGARLWLQVFVQWPVGSERIRVPGHRRAEPD